MPVVIKCVFSVSFLKTIPNPDKKTYEIKLKQPELTFLGVYGQPDFAALYVLIYPGKKVIELKSLKIYLQQYRDVIISYERLINVIYDDLIKVSRLLFILFLFKFLNNVLYKVLSSEGHKSSLRT